MKNTMGMSSLVLVALLLQFQNCYVAQGFVLSVKYTSSDNPENTDFFLENDLIEESLLTYDESDNFHNVKPSDPIFKRRKVRDLNENGDTENASGDQDLDSSGDIDLFPTMPVRKEEELPVGRLPVTENSTEINSTDSATKEKDNSTEEITHEKNNSTGSVIDGKDNSTGSVIDGKDNSTGSVIDGKDNSTGSVIGGKDNSTDSVIGGKDNSTDSVIGGKDNSTGSAIGGKDNSTHSVIDGKDNSTHSVIDGKDNSTDSVINEKDNSTGSVTKRTDILVTVKDSFVTNATVNLSTDKGNVYVTDTPEKLVTDESNSFVTNTTTRVVTDSLAKDQPDGPVTEETDKLVKNDSLVTDGRDSLVTNKTDSLVTDRIDSVVANTTTTLVTVGSDRIPTTISSSPVTEGNVRLTTNHTDSLVTEANNVVVTDNRENIVTQGKVDRVTERTTSTETPFTSNGGTGGGGEEEEEEEEEEEDETGDSSEKSDTEDTSQGYEPPVGESKKAQGQWVAIFIAALTAAVVFFFIGFFVNWQCRKSKYGREYQDIPKVTHMHYNGTEMKRFSMVDNDIVGDVSVPLNVEGNVNVDQTTSFKQGVSDGNMDDVSVPLNMEGDVNLDGTSSSKQAVQSSPIDIITAEVREDGSLLSNPLQINYSSAPQDHEITNTGREINVTPESGESSISGGPLGENKYVLDHCTIQWGLTDDAGSVHKVDGQSYAAEIHFVHWNKDAHASYQEACKSRNGIAVVVAFVKLTNDYGRQLTSICNNLGSITYKSQSCSIPLFLTTSLLPANRQKYWTYPGSLTTPSPAENVTWVIFQQPITATKTQMEAFRSLKNFEKDEGHMGDGEKETMVVLHNEIYPLGDRVVRTVPVGV